MIVETRSIAVQAIGTSTDLSMRSTEIKSVQIDNPSNCWLQLSPLNAYVPPHIVGYIRTLPQAAARVTLNFVTEPVGGEVSAATGGPIIVTLYDSNAGDNSGVSYTAATKSDIATVVASLASLINQTNPIVDILGQGLYPLTDTSIQALGGIQPNNASYILAMQNRGPNDVYVADTAFVTAALIRGNGWKIPTDGDLAMTFASGVELKATCAVGGTANLFAWTLTLTT